MRGYTRFLLTLTAAIVLAFGGCSEQSQEPVSPNTGIANTVQKENHGLQHAMEVARSNTARFLTREGVVGIGAGRAENGNPSVFIYTEHAIGKPAIPGMLKDVPVTEIVTGKIRALQVKPSKKPSNPGGGNNNKGGGGGSKVDPTSYFPTDIPIGVSTGYASGCMAGTIGFRFTKGGVIFAASNNHVFADENNYPLTDPLVQPGRYDLSCAQSYNFAELTSFVPLDFSQSGSNTVDLAWGKVTNRNLLSRTPLPNEGGYGEPNQVPLIYSNLSSYVDQPVKKYGRTTKLTTGTIVAIASFNISYSSGTAYFADQLVIQGSKGPFSRSGDSGSLIVTNDNTENPVGLLFAGSSQITIANPIGPVMTALGISSIDGK